MGASFTVHRSFCLESRGLFVVAGEITTGMVQIGMHARLRGDDDPFSQRVHGVEFVHGASEASEAEPALTFSYSSAEELDRWMSIDWPGRQIELTW